MAAGESHLLARLTWEKRKATFVYIMRATAWPRTTAGKERFGLVLPWVGLSRPEAGSVVAPEATVQVSNQNEEAVTAGSGPGSCHSLRPAPPPCVCPPSSPESSADVSHQSQPQTPLQIPERGGPPTGGRALRGPLPHHTSPAPQRSS